MSLGAIGGNDRYEGFFGSDVERYLFEGVKNFQKAWTLIGINPPMMVGLSLTGLKGLKILPMSERIGFKDVRMPDDVLMLPEVVVEDITASPDIMLRPVVDFMWNAGGFPESPHYHDGRWRSNW